MLSIQLTTSKPYINKPMAGPVFPIKKRYMSAGTQTSQAPKTGNIPKKVARRVNRRAFGTLNINKPIPAIIP